MSRRHDPRRVKAHRTYTVKALATIYDVLPAAIGAWRKDGLETIDNRRPYLFKGARVQAYLSQRIEQSRRPCGPGQIYCVACKAVQEPKGRIALVKPVSKTSGNLVGQCPTCHRQIFRRVSLEKLSAAAGTLTIRFEDTTAT